MQVSCLRSSTTRDCLNQVLSVNYFCKLKGKNPFFDVLGTVAQMYFTLFLLGRPGTRPGDFGKHKNNIYKKHQASKTTTTTTCTYFSLLLRGKIWQSNENKLAFWDRAIPKTNGGVVQTSFLACEFIGLLPMWICLIWFLCSGQTILTMKMNSQQT